MKFKKSQLDYLIGANVAKLLAERDLKKKPFAESIGMNEGQFRSLLSGKRRWNTSYIDMIAEKLGVDPIDILAPHSKQPQACPTLVIQQTDRLKAYAENSEFSIESYIPIRLLKDKIAAGNPSEIREWDIDGWVLIYADRRWMPHDPENYTCAHVQGESMWPILAPGDIVAIDHADRNPEALNGKMVAFKANGGVTVKWLRYVPGERLVIGEPENKDMRDTTVYLKGDAAQDGVVGRVAWWWSKR